MKTDSTFWTQLGAQIDQYRKRAKLNLENYEKQRFNNLYKKKKQKSLKTSESFQQNSSKLGYSMNLIRQWKRDEEQKTQIFKTRFNFIKTQRDRKIQSSQRIKNKVQKVLSIRSVSYMQKSFCQNQIKQYKSKYIDEKKKLAQRTKSQRARIEEERRKIVSQNSSRARQVRQQTLLNQQTIIKQKQIDLSLKKQAVQTGQEQYQKSLQKKRLRQYIKIQNGRQNHRRQIHNQFVNYEKVKKLNQQVLKSFQKQSRKIILQAEQAHKNLINFQTILMLRKKQQSGNSSSVNAKPKDHTSTTVSNINSPSTKVKKQSNFNNFFHLTN